MKCPMCGVQLEDNAQMCQSCGCKIVYNGYRSESTQQEQASQPAKSEPNKKKTGFIAGISVAALIIIALIAGSLSSSTPKSSSANADTPGTPGAYDWMEDQARGKDYGYDDGGDYYCMGKNDTCQNKTHNKYDLYCDSCDPDGDNIEG